MDKIIYDARKEETYFSLPCLDLIEEIISYLDIYCALFNLDHYLEGEYFPTYTAIIRNGKKHYILGDKNPDCRNVRYQIDLPYKCIINKVMLEKNRIMIKYEHGPVLYQLTATTLVIGDAVMLLELRDLIRIHL